MRNVESLRVRDPFILTDQMNQCYYLVASNRLARIDGKDGEGVDYLKTTDFIHFEEPQPLFRPPEGFFSPDQYWAPEVHEYKGRFYLFTTTWGIWPDRFVDTHVLAPGEVRGTQIFVSDNMTGPFELWSKGPLPPLENLTLDGTLYVDPQGKPYMVYCHEWLELVDGTICALPLTDDLRAPAGEPVTLFKGSDAPWATGDYVETFSGIPVNKLIWVTDGPFLFHDLSGSLCMLWSTGGEGIYTTGISRSPTGNILGPWEQTEKALFTADGGHAMLFKTLEGELRMALHQPNKHFHERLRIIPVRLTETGIEIV